MSDMPQNVNDPEKEEGDEGQPGSMSGKGWDILVGGKQNPYAAGGSDPFDLTAAAEAAAPADIQANDAETDAILKSSAGQPAPIDAVLPPDAMWDKGRGAEAPRDLGPEELASPGISAGVTVTPLGNETSAESVPIPTGPVVITEVSDPSLVAPEDSTGIVEVSKPEVPAQPAPMHPVFPPVASPPAGPTGSGIIEVGTTSAPTPAAPSPFLPKVSMPAARTVPAAGPAAPVPVVPGLSIPMGGGSYSQVVISDPFASQTDLPLSLREIDLPPDPALEKKLITSQRINALWDEINETYNLVINDVRGHFNTTQEAIAQLAEARELLLSGTANFDDAEELVKQVKARLRLEEKVRQWSVHRGTWIATYLIIWFLVLSMGTIAGSVYGLEALALKYIPEFLVSTWLPTVFGILGGVIGALWVLNKHITKKRDFDPIHTMWYVTNPFLGGALGIVTYFLVRGGGFVVAGGSAIPLTDLTKLILCGMSIIVGFNQNVLWSLVDRFLKAAFPEKPEEQSAVTDNSSQGGSASSSGRSGTGDSGG